MWLSSNALIYAVDRYFPVEVDQDETQLDPKVIQRECLHTLPPSIYSEISETTAQLRKTL